MLDVRLVATRKRKFARLLLGAGVAALIGAGAIATTEDTGSQGPIMVTGAGLLVGALGLVNYLWDHPRAPTEPEIWGAPGAPGRWPRRRSYAGRIVAADGVSIGVGAAGIALFSYGLSKGAFALGFCDQPDSCGGDGTAILGGVLTLVGAVGYLVAAPVVHARQHHRGATARSVAMRLVGALIGAAFVSTMRHDKPEKWFALGGALLVPPVIDAAANSSVTDR